MKSTITTLLIFFSVGLFAQNVSYENLPAFDKLVVDGNVKTIHTKQGCGEKPQLKVTGIDKDLIKTKTEAGVMHLTLNSDKPAELVVYNGNLNRIETEGDTEIVGAEVVGSNGKYLLTDFNHYHGPVANHVQVDLPRIEINVPGVEVDIPELNFDFEHHFDHDFDIDVDWDEDNWNFSWNWDDHKREFRHVSEDVRDEVRRVMEEVREEVRRHRKD